MYCRYAKTTIFDHKKCPLNGGEFYIVSFIRSVLYSEVPLYSQICLCCIVCWTHLPQLAYSTKQIRFGTDHRCCCFTGLRAGELLISKRL